MAQNLNVFLNDTFDNIIKKIFAVQRSHKIKRKLTNREKIFAMDLLQTEG
jgi:hypothetical protein